MPFLFNNRTKQLETEIDKYLDSVLKAGLIFYEGVKHYLSNDKKAFQNDFDKISELETSADNIRREIKTKLYTYMLIPESRGDVLGLLETLDDVVDICEIVLKQLSIENPEMPDYLKEDFLELSEFSQKTVEELVKGARAFFKEINMVNDFVNKVHFYEHEADDVEEQLKRKIFGTDKIPRFSRKIHMRYFAEKIAAVSDVAEDVAERLAVYAIKRKI
jgi:predicted phosphate transport protein (TIGR00153 family)